MIDRLPGNMLCADNDGKLGLVPFHHVCMHLLEGETIRAVRLTVNDGREVACDYVCPPCAELVRRGDKIYIAPRCMYCVRDMRRGWQVH